MARAAGTVFVASTASNAAEVREGTFAVEVVDVGPLAAGEI